MAWNDRLREAAYTSPSGNRIIFGYENVAKVVTKKTTGFNFPDADGTYVQDLGSTGRRYPMRIFFWGDDHDLESAEFESALLEIGVGKLEHPLYGSVDVVPFGDIKTRDDLKTASNQSIIEVSFWDTIGLIYPTGEADKSASVITAVKDYNNAAAGGFVDSTSLDSAIEQVTFENNYQTLLDSVQSSLQSIADVQDNVRVQFDAIVDSVNQGIDVLISQPLTLAFQTLQLIQAPARALTNIDTRLSAYSDLATSIITGEGAVVSAGNDSRNANEVHTNDLYVSTYVTGSILSVVNNQFITKTEALQAADKLLQQLEDVTNWRDDNFASLEEVDSGASYQQLQDAVALTAGFLVQISFTLKQERSIILTKDRTIIDLSAELYGSVDDKLDFLISSNNLSGSEILELKKGREIVYYI